MTGSLDPTAQVECKDTTNSLADFHDIEKGPQEDSSIFDRKLFEISNKPPISPSFVYGLIIAPFPFTLSVLASTVNGEFDSTPVTDSLTTGAIIFSCTYLVNFAFGWGCLETMAKNPQKPANEIFTDMASGFVSTVAPFIAFLNNPFNNNIAQKVTALFGFLSLFRSSAIYGQQMTPNLIRMFYTLSKFTPWLTSTMLRINSFYAWEKMDVLYHKTNLIQQERQISEALREIHLETIIYLNHPKYTQQFSNQVKNRIAIFKGLLEQLNNLNTSQTIEDYETGLKEINSKLPTTKNLQELYELRYNTASKFGSCLPSFVAPYASRPLSYLPQLAALTLLPPVLLVTIAESLESDIKGQPSPVLRDAILLSIAVPVLTMGLDTLNQIKNALHGWQLSGNGEQSWTDFFSLSPFNTNYPDLTLGAIKAVFMSLILFSFGGIFMVGKDVIDPDKEVNFNNDKYLYDIMADLIPAISKLISFTATLTILCAGVPVFNSYGAFFDFFPNILDKRIKPFLDRSFGTTEQTPVHQSDIAVDLNKLIDNISTAINDSKNRQIHVRHDGKTLYSEQWITQPDVASVKTIGKYAHNFWQSCNGKKERDSDDSLNEALIVERGG